MNHNERKKLLETEDDGVLRQLDNDRNISAQDEKKEKPKNVS